MNKPIFCLVGLSGVGKSTYLDAIRDNKLFKSLDLKELKYHTTREKRYPEENDYHFVSIDEWNNVDKNSIIEFRKYKKIPNDVYYYTTKDDINVDDCSALICTASIDQVLSYINKLDNIYIIDIKVSIKNRLERLFKRCNTENEYYEVCRRTIEEKEEYSKLESISNSKLIIYNDNDIADKEYIINKNIINIYNYIDKIINKDTYY